MIKTACVKIKDEESSDALMCHHGKLGEPNGSSR